jgi:23S rRNA G2069 N7-methylase RlmK/C1962 C5-methylase RlmI
VDLSNTYCAWAERNMKLNQLYDKSKTIFHTSDCLNWINQAKQKVEKYDLIICDPPTFSNSKKMSESSFSIDRDHPWLLLDLAKLLKPNGKVFFSNNSRNFELEEGPLSKVFEIEPWSHKSISEDFRNTKIHQSWWLTKK